MILHRRLLSQEVLKSTITLWYIIVIAFVVVSDFFTSESCVPDA